MAKFVNIDRETPMLIPADMRDWLPDNHIVHFIIDAVEHLEAAELSPRFFISRPDAKTMALFLHVRRA